MKEPLVSSQKLVNYRISWQMELKWRQQPQQQSETHRLLFQNVPCRNKEFALRPDQNHPTPPSPQKNMPRISRSLRVGSRRAEASRDHSPVRLDICPNRLQNRFNRVRRRWSGEKKIRKEWGEKREAQEEEWKPSGREEQLKTGKKKRRKVEREGVMVERMKDGRRDEVLSWGKGEIRGRKWMFEAAEEWRENNYVCWPQTSDRNALF